MSSKVLGSEDGHCVHVEVMVNDDTLTQKTGAGALWLEVSLPCSQDPEKGTVIYYTRFNSTN